MSFRRVGREYAGGNESLRKRRPPEKMRQTWAALAGSVHKMHLCGRGHSRKTTPMTAGTRGMAFEKLILEEFSGPQIFAARRSG